VSPQGGTRDIVAADHYRAGLHAWQTRSPSGLGRAVAEFNAAIQRDPRYAQAYMGLANSYNLLPEFTLMAPAQAYAKAADAASRAIALAPSLAGAHAALAFADFYGRRDVASARREFSRAITLDPNDAIAHHWYATFLMTIGDFDAARVQIDRAAQLDPESAAILADKALILFYAGSARDAVTLLKQLETDQPQFASPHYYLSAIALMQGDDTDYLREMKLMADARHDAQGAALAAARISAPSFVSARSSDASDQARVAQQAVEIHSTAEPRKQRIDPGAGKFGLGAQQAGLQIGERSTAIPQLGIGLR
jgi:Tfp pilus assembly protein PilF